MKEIQVKEGSVYGQSPRGLSKFWWRNFIRQSAAAGYIYRSIKTAQSRGAYASLSVTASGRQVVSEKRCVMLPDVFPQMPQIESNSKSFNQSSDNQEASSSSQHTKKRQGKGCHLLPLVRQLVEAKENWKPIKCKEAQNKMFCCMLMTLLLFHTTFKMTRILYGKTYSLAKEVQKNRLFKFS